jgi:glycogen debranching enzyme
VIAPFQILWDAGAYQDLERRLKNTRWADAVTDDWSYGMEANFLQTLVAFWLRDYHWAARLCQPKCTGR